MQARTYMSSYSEISLYIHAKPHYRVVHIFTVHLYKTTLIIPVSVIKLSENNGNMVFLASGFREKDENVKVYGRWTPSDNKR